MNDSPPEAASDDAGSRSLRLPAGLRVFGSLTLLSRLLGLARDVGMAVLFGGGALLDAFTVAFRAPNLARRLFGEGALSAAFIPVFLREQERDRNAAWRMAGTMLVALAGLLTLLVLAGETGLWLISREIGPDSDSQFLVNLAAIMLPYLVVICLAAQLSAMLESQGRFAWPALLPVVLNLIWLAAIALAALWLESPVERMYFVAGAIVFGGCVQLMGPVASLWKRGLRLQLGFREHRGTLREIARTTLPILIGLSITQINALADSLIAWFFSAPEHGAERMPLPGRPWYPMEAGAASALYLGQRMYQFPLGVFGVALGVVLYPQLTRHAAHGRRDLFAADLSLGLRLVLAVGIPASAGLVILAGPLSVLLFQYGAFDAFDTERTAVMISGYGWAVWAYCGLLIVNRGFFSQGLRRTPVVIGVAAVAVNITLDLVLIWPFGSFGLALATSITSVLQVVAAAWLLYAAMDRFAPPDAPDVPQQPVSSDGLATLWPTAFKSCVATAAMSLVCLIAVWALPESDAFGWRLAAVLGPVAAGLVAYAIAARIMRIDEFRLLWKR